MKKSGKIRVRVDKSWSIYKISQSEYEQILNDITDSNKIEYSNTLILIYKDTVNFADKRQIKDRLGK